MEIKYTVKLSILNKISNLIIDFNKDFKFTIDKPDIQLYDNVHDIWHGYILELMREEVNNYLHSEKINEEDIEIEGYEISTTNVGLDIFFENPVNPTEYTLTPTIKVYVHSKITEIPIPILNGHLLNNTSIAWTWDKDENYAHYITDEKDNILAQLPIGISQYTETQLKPSTAYIRKLISYDADSSSKPSLPIKLFTGKDTEVLELKTYSPKHNERSLSDDIILNDKTIVPNLKAFKSGIGDNKDCMIIKQSDTNFYEKFDLQTNIYGIYNKNITLYNQVKFDYRARVDAKYLSQEQDGHCNFILKAYPIEKIKFRVYKYALKHGDVNYVLSAKVIYYERNEDGVSEQRYKIVKAPEQYVTLLNDPLYEAGKYIALVPLTSLDPVSMISKGKTARQIIDEVCQTDSAIMASDCGYSISDYEIFSDYKFDLASNRYKKSSPRSLSSSANGTINISDGDGTFDVDGNRCIYIEGFMESELFHAEKYIEKEFSYLDGKNATFLSEAEMNIGPLKCVSDDSYIYDGTDIVTVVEIVSKGVHMETSAINTNGGGAPCTGFVNKMYETPLLTYEFSNEDEWSYIRFNQILENLDSDITVEYNYELQVVDSSTNIQLNVRPNYITTGELIKWRKNSLFHISLYSHPITVVKDWFEIKPDPMEEEALHGIVNGRFVIGNGFNGKQDLEVELTKFNILDKMFDVRFSVVIDGINPPTSVIATNFKTTPPEPGVGVVNGDSVIFSSDSVTNKYETFKDLLSVLNFNDLEIFDLKDNLFKFDIPKPIIPSDKQNLYTRYGIDVLSSNNDVGVKSYQDEILFTKNPELISITVKGVQNATSQWNPRMHNGYYYMNQHEHFVYSNGRVNGNYKPTTRVLSDYIFYSISVDLLITDRTPRYYHISKVLKHHFIDYSTTFSFVDGFLIANPIIDTKHYKEYLPVVYVSPSMSFPNVITTYGVAKWDELCEGSSTLDVTMRSYNLLLGDWNDWVSVSSGSVPNIERSSVVQFRAILNTVVENSYETVMETDCCWNDYNVNASLKTEPEDVQCVNVQYKADYLQLIDNKTKGVYVSKIRDFGTIVEFNIDAYKSSNSVKIFVASSNSKESLSINPIYNPITLQPTSIGRYIRYKIEIPAGEKVYLVYKKINTLVSKVNRVGIGNFSLDATYIPEDKTYHFTDDYSQKIPFDMNYYPVADSIKEIIEPTVKLAGYELSNITNVVILPKSEDTILDYGVIDIHSLDNTIKAKSRIRKDDNSLKTNYLIFNGDSTKLSPLPQQYCPIIIQDDILGSLQYVDFVDENDIPVLYNKESFISSKQKIFELNYKNIDLKSLEIKCDNVLVDISKFDLLSNVIEFKEYVKEKTIVDVKYKLRNSFIVTYDIPNNEAILLVNTDSPITNARVQYETNLMDNKKALSNISLNPIYNIDNKGFIFISYEDFAAVTLKVYSNPGELIANGKDCTTIFAKLEDAYGNPVSGEKLIIENYLGTVEVDDYITDYNGVVSMLYTSTITPTIDTIIVSTSSGLKDSVKIINRKKVV